MSSEGGMGVKHLQVRLTTEEYQQYGDLAGEGKMQTHLRNLILREIAGEAQAGPLDGLTKDDRALVLDLIAWLRNEPPGDKKRRNIVRGILTVFRG
jgi:hypothetical protein